MMLPVGAHHRSIPLRDAPLNTLEDAILFSISSTNRALPSIMEEQLKARGRHALATLPLEHATDIRRSNHDEDRNFSLS